MITNGIRAAQRPLIVASLVGSAAALVHVPAHAVTKKECAAAYEETQSLQKDGKFKDARAKALFCSQDACPAAVKVDCSKWLGEIEASLPTVVFSVIGPDGQETASARVVMDGQPLADRTDGKAVAVDPGEHRFRFDLPGSKAIERTLVLREGEKLRKIDASFTAAKQEVNEPPPAGSPGKPAEQGPGAPVVPILVGALGVAAIGVGATFGALGLAEKGDLEKSCAPGCTDDRVDSVRTKLLAADIGVAAGAVALGTAVIVYLVTRPSAPPAARGTAQSLRIGAAPSKNGGFATVGLSF
jgi:hypothetical protein